MADQTRQTKLAAAKKKLKEFQQKSTPPTGGAGAKKKRKVKGGTDTPTEERRSPDSVSDRPLGFALTYHPLNLPTPNFANAANSEYLCPRRPLSSTESLRQLSQQLNGLLSEVGAPPGPPRLGPAQNQELATALDSSRLTNSQLSAKLDQLVRVSVWLCERKEFEQKFVKEQGAMREQLQVHIQTIGILVSEKSELQTALSYTQQAARQRTGEAEELGSRLQASKQRISELERTLSSVSTQQKQFEKHNKELEKERDNFRLEVYRLGQASEEANERSSELAEQLKLKLSENSAMQLNLEDLRKRLEMADLMIQQFSSQSGPPSANQQVAMLLEEKLQMEAHSAQLQESIAQLQRERDQYAAQIQREALVWKEKTEQLLSQVTLLSKERDGFVEQVRELEAQITELKNSAVPLTQEVEPQAPAQPVGPSESERALQESLGSMQQEKEALSLQYQAQVRDNEQLSRLCQEQEARLAELEREEERRATDAEDRRRMLEDVQSDKATLSRALTQNRELKEQLAELQNGFVKLTNENMELTSGLQSEQHVKKELARKMGQLQEDLHHVREQLAAKSQEAQAALEQRDQYLVHLQQYTASYQQLASEREEVTRHLLQQTQLMDRLQHDEVQGKVQLEISHKQLEQDKLDQLVKDNEDLKMEVRELLSSTALAIETRDQGDGLESRPFQESFQTSSIAIPDDFDSQEDMAAFLRSTVSQLEGERDKALRRMEEEQRLRQAALHQVATLSQEQQQHQQHSPHASTDGVPVEVHEALRAAMEKLQLRFTTLMQEKVDLKERVEELEHRCIQLSGETDTIGEYIALYQNQRAIMKQRHMEKDQYINMLAKDKEEMKAKLAELQELVLRLVDERNEWHSRYMGITGDPDLLPDSTATAALGAHRRMDSVDFAADPALMSEVDGPQGTMESSGVPTLRPREDGTARQIMQLLQEIQNPQPVPFLGENPCIPFFYRPDEHDEVKILVV
uniref:Golgin A2 n=1 Tax=Paramormyrops kingsleyae TaxID=1676925 RepID=A0A3B3RNN5_9TELE